MSLKAADENLKHLDYLQRKSGTSDKERKKIAVELANGTLRFNKELSKEKKKDNDRMSFDRNLEKSQDVFNKLGKNRKVFYFG